MPSLLRAAIVLPLFLAVGCGADVAEDPQGDDVGQVASAIWPPHTNTTMLVEVTDRVRDNKHQVASNDQGMMFRAFLAGGSTRRAICQIDNRGDDAVTLDETDCMLQCRDDGTTIYANGPLTIAKTNGKFVKDVSCPEGDEAMEVRGVFLVASAPASHDVERSSVVPSVTRGELIDYVRNSSSVMMYIPKGTLKSLWRTTDKAKATYTNTTSAAVTVSLRADLYCGTSGDDEFVGATSPSTSVAAGASLSVETGTCTGGRTAKAAIAYVP